MYLAPRMPGLALDGEPEFDAITGLRAHHVPRRNRDCECGAGDAVDRGGATVAMGDPQAIGEVVE